MTDIPIRFLYYFLFFLTPLIMAPFTSELFEFNKMMFIYLMTLIISALWILKMIMHKKIIVKKTFLDIPILFFLGSQILSTIFSIDRHTSFFGYYGRFNGGMLSIISYILLYYAFVSNFRKDEVIKLLKLSLISSFIVILWGLPGKLGHDFSCLIFTGTFSNTCWTDQFRPAERMFSTLGQPNWLGAYLAIHFFIALYFFIKGILNQVQDDKKNILCGLYLFVNFVAILFTRSRSALFAVVFGLVLFGTFFYFMFKKHIGRAIIVKFLILVLAFCVSILFFKTGIARIDKFISLSTYIRPTNITASVIQELAQHAESGVTESGDIRKIVWKGAIDLGLKYPLFGTGVETFAYSYYFTRPQEHNLTSEWDFLYNKAHNEYLNYFATTGLTGLTAYIFMVGSVLYFLISNIKYQKSKMQSKFRKEGFFQKTDDKILITCLFLSYLTILMTNFFGFSTTTINLFFYIIPACLAILFKQGGGVDESFNHKIDPLDKKQWLAVSFLTFFLLWGFQYLAKYYLADVKYAKGDNLAKVGEFQKSVQYYNSALNLREDHVYEDKLSYALANVTFLASYQNESELAKKTFVLSDGLNLKSLRSSQKNVLYWKTRAKNHYLFYQFSLDSRDLEAGVDALKTARQLSPTDPKIPYSLAIYYSLWQDEAKDATKKKQLSQKSLSEIEIAIGLKPDYRDGYFLQGQLLKKSGKKDLAKKAFDYILTNLNPSDSEARKEIEGL